MPNCLYKWLMIVSAVLATDFLFASSTATVTVTINVTAEADIAFSGNPSTFNVNPGNSPQSNTTTTYSVTTNQTSQRISALYSPALPSGVSLVVTLAAPTGATSAGAVTLSTTTQNLVTAISQVNQAGLAVTYAVSATPTAAVASGITTTITYTIST